MCCYTYKRRTDVVGKEQDAIDLKDVLADGVALGPWGRERSINVLLARQREQMIEKEKDREGWWIKKKETWDSYGLGVQMVRVLSV